MTSVAGAGLLSCLCTFWAPVTLHAQLLCPGAKSNLRGQVLGEVEENSFIALPSKGGHGGFLASKRCVPTQEDGMGGSVVQGWAC